jgi:hypothetical protein
MGEWCKDVDSVAEQQPLTITQKSAVRCRWEYSCWVSSAIKGVN